MPAETEEHYLKREETYEEMEGNIYGIAAERIS